MIRKLLPYCTRTRTAATLATRTAAAAAAAAARVTTTDATATLNRSTITEKKERGRIRQGCRQGRRKGNYQGSNNYGPTKNRIEPNLCVGVLPIILPRHHYPIGQHLIFVRSWKCVLYEDTTWDVELSWVEWSGVEWSRMWCDDNITIIEQKLPRHATPHHTTIHLQQSIWFDLAVTTNNHS